MNSNLVGKCVNWVAQQETSFGPPPSPQLQAFEGSKKCTEYAHVGT